MPLRPIDHLAAALRGQSNNQMPAPHVAGEAVAVFCGGPFDGLERPASEVLRDGEPMATVRITATRDKDGADVDVEYHYGGRNKGKYVYATEDGR